MLQEPPHKFVTPREVYLIAMRIWHGLEIIPAIPHVDEMSKFCPSIRAVKKTACNKPLDRTGRHAMICNCGGKHVIRHNLLRDFVGHALRRLVSGVWWETAVAEIERENGEEARLDLIVEDPVAPAYLDFVVVFPLAIDGQSVQCSVATAEGTKFGKYPVTRDGRRLTNVPLVPFAVNVLGQLGNSAQEYLSSVERAAKAISRPYRPPPGQPPTIAALATLVTVLEVAHIVYRCHTKCKGENEHTLAQEAAEQAAEKEAKRLARPSTRRPQKVASKAAEHSAPPPTRRSRKGAPPRAPVGSLHNDSEPRCAQCGLSRTECPATCVQCVNKKARRAHDKVDGEPAASCLKGRCPPQCVGRNPGVP